MSVEDPGVPEALPRTLQRVGARLTPGSLDRLWIFPPLVRGRREWGLVVASTFADGERRVLHTGRYQAERTGTGLTYDFELSEEGAAPRDRLPRVVDGVTRRSRFELGEPREVGIEGDPDRFEDLLAEFDASLLESEPAAS